MDRLVVLFLFALLCITWGKKDHTKQKSKQKSKLADKTAQKIHELSPSRDFNEEQLDDSYKGCFEMPSAFSKERTDSYNSNKECGKFCGESTNIFGTSDNKCYCFDEIPSVRKKDSECSTRCPDPMVPGECSGLDCCGGDNRVSVYATSSADQISGAKRTHSSTNIQGCFNDKETNLFANEATLKRVDSENTIFRCSEFCLDKAFGVASVRTDHCYCTNVLPLERLYIGVDGSKECNLFCAGIYRPSGQCVRDECCGGEQSDGRHTFTVYVSGTLDVLKQTIYRVLHNSVTDEDFWREPLCPSGWTQHGMSCIQFGSEKKNLNDAKKDCESKNAYLFTIKNRADKALWTSKILEKRQELAEEIGSEPVATFYTRFLWVGLNYNIEKSRWQWMNGKPVRLWIFQKEPSEDFCPAFVAQYTENEVFYLYGHYYSCDSELYYFCQSHISLQVEAKNPGSGESNGFQSYSMDFDYPGVIKMEKNVPEVDASDKIVTLTVTDFEQQIKKAMAPSQNFLAGSDVTYPNKDSDEPGKFIYQYSVAATASTSVTINNGQSTAFHIGTEFKTRIFGVAFKLKADLEHTRTWSESKVDYSSDTTTHLYRFEFPVPAHCDATIAIMQDELPTRIDWRATFFIEGWVNVKVLGGKTPFELSTMLTGSQRHLYSFGTSDFGDRPTIVPIKTLDCTEGQREPERLEQCVDPDTQGTEECEVPVEV